MAEHGEPPLIWWDEERGCASGPGLEPSNTKNGHIYSTSRQPRSSPRRHMLHTELKQSTRQHTSGKYVCCICSKGFPEGFGLQDHMERKHMTPESSMCTTCGRLYSFHTRVDADEQRHYSSTHMSDKYACGGELRGQGGRRWGCNRVFTLESGLYEHFRTQDGQACIAPLLSEEHYEPAQMTDPLSPSALTWSSSIHGSGSRSISTLPTTLMTRYPKLQGWIRNKNRNEENNIHGRSLMRRSMGRNTEPEPIVQVADMTALAGEHLTEDIVKHQQNNNDDPWLLSHNSFEPRTDMHHYEVRKNDGGSNLASRRSGVHSFVIPILNPREVGDASNPSYEISQQVSDSPHLAEEHATQSRARSLVDIVGQQSSVQVEAEMAVVSPVPSHDSGNYNSNSESELSFIGAFCSDTDIIQIDELDLEAWCIVDELAQRAVKEYLRRYGCTGYKTCPGQQYGNSSSYGKGSTVKASDAKMPKVTKRTYHERDNEERSDDEEEDEDGGGPTPKRVKESDGKPMRLFACPYAKFDPQRYSEQNQTEKKYRKCSSKYLKDVTRVKQHLYRTHQRPDWYCGNCFQNFKSREELNTHIRRRPPCDQQPAKYEEMMTDAQFNQVKKRSQERSDRESWYKVYEILFPQSSKPMSPYVSSSDPATVQHFVTFFQWFGPEDILNLVRTRHEQNAGFPQIEASTQAVIDEALEVALPEYLEQIGLNGQFEQQPRTRFAQVDEEDSDRLYGPAPLLEESGINIHLSHEANCQSFDEANNEVEQRISDPGPQSRTTHHEHQGGHRVMQYMNEGVPNLPEVSFQGYHSNTLPADPILDMYDILVDFSACSLPGTDVSYQPTRVSSLS